VMSGVLLLLLGATGAYAQSEIILTAGMFAKDSTRYVTESGGYAGTYVQHGTYRFPADHGEVLVGITTLLPSTWAGEDIDIVFGGQTGGSSSQQFRIVGQIESTTFGETETLTLEDSGGTTEVVVVSGYTVPSNRRFAIAIGRDANHGDDTTLMSMNFEYLALRLQ